MLWTEQEPSSKWQLKDYQGQYTGISIVKKRGSLVGELVSVYSIFADNEYLGRAQSLDASKLLGSSYYTKLLAGWVC